jgi:hypothetical protein
MPLRSVPFDDIVIQDEASFAHVALYDRLKGVLRSAKHRFLVPAEGTVVGWDRAVFLNLTFWSGAASMDVLCDEHVPADVVAHVAWHHLAAEALNDGTAGAPSAAALFFGESIASAFDLYLVGRLLPNAPDSDFITTQVPILTEVAREAGLADEDFEALLAAIVAEPELAFEDLRALLFETALALLDCPDAVAAQAALEERAHHRFAPLLHHYQLSNWVLYARAYAASIGAAQPMKLHQRMKAAPDSLAWLEEHWLADRGVA